MTGELARQRRDVNHQKAGPSKAIRKGRHGLFPGGAADVLRKERCVHDRHAHG
jgi:hypothetical protein